MKHLYISIVFAVIICISANAQSSLREGRGIPQKTVVKPEPKIKEDKKEQPTVADTIYCVSTKKQHGWFAPMDTISREIAAKRDLSYRFTKKNKAGNWGKLECINADGEYIQGTLSPYILNIGSSDTDSHANQDWVEKLKTACIHEFISDYSGKTIIQERAYDKNMNIVYTFSRVKVGDRQFIGSYKDYYGLPAEMREEEGYTYGTLVKITEDRFGNDSTIQFIDAKGTPKLNADSVAIQVYIQDKDGHLLKGQSRDKDGNLVIDNWGNCGVEFEWDTERHLCIKGTYMDDKWQPMRMPGNRTTNRENIISTNYEYDAYKRNTVECYTDNYGNKDQNPLGTHKIITEYDNKGRVIRHEGYDKNENLSPINESYASIMLFSYNNRTGKQVSAEYLDKDGRPITTENYYSKITDEYNDEGELIAHVNYYVKDGVEQIQSSNRYSKDCNHHLWYDGTSRIDSLDSKGRLTYRGYYDAGGKLMTEGSIAFQRNIYMDKDKGCVHIEKNYGPDGDIVTGEYGWGIQIITADSTRRTDFKKQYDTNNNLLSTFIMLMDENFELPISEYDANEFGIPARCGGTASVRHYKGDVIYNSGKNSFATLVGRDEFDEPDYIVSSNALYYYQKLFPKAGSKFYDENNNEIKDISSLRDSLCKVMTIEVIDSTAYSLGLKDNDVILLYGNYAANFCQTISYNDFKADWTVRSVLDAGMNKRMVVFRIDDAKNNKYGLVEINNLVGTPSECGFIPHIRYLTEKQEERISGAIDDNISGENPLVKADDFTRELTKGNNCLIVTYNELYRAERFKPYNVQVKDPAILLGACISDRDMAWKSIEDGENTQPFADLLATRQEEAAMYPQLDFFYTKNAGDIIRVTTKEKAIFAQSIEAWVTDEEYARLVDLMSKAEKEIDEIMNVDSPYDSKQIAGKWKLENNDGQYLPHGEIELSKDGTSSGYLAYYGTINYDVGNAVFKIKCDYTGTWKYKGELIAFDLSDDNRSIECVDLIGADEQLKKKAVEFVNSRIADNPEEYFKSVTYLLEPLGEDFFIKSFEKNTLEIHDGNNGIFKLLRSKEKIKQDTKKSQAKKKGRIKKGRNHDLILGNWEATIPDMEGSYAALTFKEDGRFALNAECSMQEMLADTIAIKMSIRISIQGDWALEDYSLSLTEDPASINADMDVDIVGANEEQEQELRARIDKEVASQIDNAIISMLKENIFGESLEMTEINSGALIINGTKWTRVHIQQD